MSDSAKQVRDFAFSVFKRSVKENAVSADEWSALGNIIKDAFRDVLTENFMPEDDAAPKTLPSAWVRYLNFVRQNVPVKIHIDFLGPEFRASENDKRDKDAMSSAYADAAADVETRVLKQWTPSKTGNRGIALASYYYAHLSDEPRLVSAAQEVNRKVLGSTFAQKFGVEVPVNDEEAKRLEMVLDDLWLAKQGNQNAQQDDLLEPETKSQKSVVAPSSTLQKAGDHGAKQETKKPKPLFRLPRFISEQDALGMMPTASAWLSPHNHFSVPFAGREQEWALLQNFMDRNDPFLISAIIAPSGAGKTRLISEWMRFCSEADFAEDWRLGFMEDPDPSSWDEEHWNPDKNTLIAVDYFQLFSEAVGVIANRFSESSQCKVRIIILDHVLPKYLHQDSAWRSVVPTAKQRVESDPVFYKPFPITIRPAEDKKDFLKEIISAAADPYNKVKRFDKNSEVVKKAADALFEIDAKRLDDGASDEHKNRTSVRHPLYAALFGQLISFDPDTKFKSIKRRDLIELYFEGSNRLPWRRGSAGAEYGSHGFWSGFIVSLATLFRGLSVADYLTVQDAIFESTGVDFNHSEFENIVDECARITSHSSRNAFVQFEPDILGEVFFLKFLDEFRGHRELFSILALAISETIGQKGRFAGMNVFFTLQRLIRNLINDEQSSPEVQASWDILNRFLDPKWRNEPLTSGVLSLVVVELAKQRSLAGLEFDRHFPNSVNFEGLDAVSSVGFVELAAAASVRCIDNHFMLETSDAGLNPAVWKPLSRFKAKTKLSVSTFATRENCRLAVPRILEEFHESIDDFDKDGWTTLNVACAIGDERTVEWALENGACPNFTLLDLGWTPLLHATHYGYESIVEELIRHGANVNIPDLDVAFTPLISACQSGYISIVEKLVSAGADTEAMRQDSGTTPLMSAVAVGSLSVVEFLIDQSVDIDRYDVKWGFNALLIAIEYKHTAIAKVLIERGANVNASNIRTGATALALACRTNQTEVVRSLVDRGANVNGAFATNGTTPLMIASGEGNETVVEVLLNAGAKVELSRYDNGSTALHFASNQGSLTVVQRLLTAGADPNAKTRYFGWTPLMSAVKSGATEVVKELLSHGATVHLPNEVTGWCAVKEATKCFNTPIAKLLLTNSPNCPTYPNSSEVTCLAVAKASGNKEVEELILGLGNEDFELSHEQDTVAMLAISDAGVAFTAAAATKPEADLAVWSADDGKCVFAILEDDQFRLRFAPGDITQPKLRRGLNQYAFVKSCGDPSFNINENRLCDNAMVDVRVDSQGLTALMYASHFGNESTLDELLNRNAMLNIRLTPEGSTAIYEAVSNGHFAVAKKLMNAGALLQFDGARTDDTVLNSTIRSGEREMLKLALALGASPSWSSQSRGITPLITAVLENDLEAVELLLAAGAPANQRTFENGGTALLAAIQANEVLIAKTLLSSGADVSMGSSDLDITPLMLAASKSADAVALLLDFGACPNQISRKDATASLSFACLSNDTGTATMLLEAGANLNHQNISGETALMIACEQSSIAHVNLFLERGADTEIQSRSGDTVHSISERVANDEIKRAFASHL